MQCEVVTTNVAKDLPQYTTKNPKWHLSFYKTMPLKILTSQNFPVKCSSLGDLMIIKQHIGTATEDMIWVHDIGHHTIVAESNRICQAQVNHEISPKSES
jgi:hypothetical protein